MPGTDLLAGAFTDAVAAAVRAPSLHNSQPWAFRLRDGAVEVYADRARFLPATDPTGWGARLACGAATFNLRLALAVSGLPTDVRWRPEREQPDLMARVVPLESRPATPPQRRLFHAIWQRHSNRAPFSDRPVPLDTRAALVSAARAEQAWLELLTGAASVGAVAELARAANGVLERDPGYRAELAAWTRLADTAVDGVPAVAGGPSPQPQDLLPQRILSGQDRAASRDFEAQPVVGVLGTAGDLPSDQLVGGHALQHVLLTVTDLGLAASMLSQPIEIASTRERLRMALGRFGTPQMVLRLGYGVPGFPTARRALADVILH